jgi:hypothetical protein
MQCCLAAHAALDRTAPHVEGRGDLAAAGLELPGVAEIIGDHFGLGFHRLHRKDPHCARRENSVK